MFHREAKAYLNSSIKLRNSEPSKEVRDWEARNPVYFLLLHATELGIKSIVQSRGNEPPRSHDIVSLVRKFASRSDRKHARRTYRELRSLREQQLRDKWSGGNDGFALAGLQIELEEAREEPVYMVATLKLLGALGQSEMRKLEFGSEVEPWWHAARYPRHGVTSYPDFDRAVLICKSFIELAGLELSSTE